MRKSLKTMVLSLATVVCLTSGAGFALDPASGDGGPPAAATAERGVDAIMNDFQAAASELQPLVGGPEDLLDPAKRAELSTKVLPILKRMQGFADEMIASSEPGKSLGKRVKTQLDSMLSLFGDEAATARVEAAAADADPEVALRAKSSLLFNAWIKSNQQPAAQEKLAADAEALAKAHPTSDDVTALLLQMGEVGAADAKLQARLRDAATSMTSDMAGQYKAQADGDAKLAAMVEKPLTLAGVRHTGEQFSTESLKGKVVLVDFWATWCRPCLAELPRVKKIYQQYREKGLEIVGVSCDESADDLKTFLAENPDMPWPQLFDATAPGWHALAKEYGINGIPTMFLIDKKGVLRSVKAREELEELIPKLLAE